MLNFTAEQIAQYRRDGFLIVDRIISDERVAELKSRFEPLFTEGHYETGIRPDEVNLPEGDPPYTKQICNGWRADLTVARTAFDAEIGRACATLAGWPGARLQIDNLLWKPPAGRPIGFHQDSAYLHWLDKPDMTTCWIALDDTTAEGGPIMYLRGSQKWGISQPIARFHGPEDDMLEAREWAEKNGFEIDLVPIVVPAGGGAFHDGWTWHGSRVNRMPVPRRSVSIHMLNAEARYNPDKLTIGTGPVYSRFMKFGTNELDDNFFPITWHESGYRTPGLDDYIRRGRKVAA